MKKLLLTVIILVIIFALVLGIALYNANSLIAIIKPQIEKAASEALKARVSLGKIEASVFPNATLKVDEVKIARSQDAKNPLSLQNLVLAVKLVPLLSGKVEVIKLSLEKPSIVLIKDESGVKIEGLNQEQKSEVKSESPGSVNETKAPKEAQNSASKLQLNLDSINISDGKILFRDLIAKKDYAITAFSLGAKVTMDGSSLIFPSLKISAVAVGSPIEISGKEGKYNLDTGVFAIPDVNVKIAGNTSISVAGYEIKNFEGALSVAGNKESQTVNAKSIALFVNGVPIKLQGDIKASKSAVDISDLKIDALSGSVIGKIKYILGENKVSLLLDGAALNVSEGAPLLKQPILTNYKGNIDKVHINVTGNTANLVGSLNGDSTLSLKDGEFQGFNIAGQTLKQIKDIPFISGSLYSQVPPEKLGLLEKNSTAVKKLAAAIQLQNGEIILNSFDLVSDLFRLDGEGRINSSGTLDLNTTIYFDKDFSGVLALKVKELKNLLDADGSLVIPLTIKGTPPAVTVVPNMQKLLEVGTKAVIKEKAADLLGRALGGKKDGSGKGGKLGGLLGF